MYNDYNINKMDINIKVTVDLSEKTLILLTNCISITKNTKVQESSKDLQEANGSLEMSIVDKFEYIKDEVTKHLKRGKSADIKHLLSLFKANCISELAHKDYDAFYDVIKQYGRGEIIL